MKDALLVLTIATTMFALGGAAWWLLTGHSHVLTLTIILLAMRAGVDQIRIMMEEEK